MTKTATELFNEYYALKPAERINSTVQDYVFNHQQKRIDELEKDLTHWKQSYWKQAERLAEYDSIFISNNDDLEVLCFKKEKEIERLEIQLKALRGEHE